jgi:hypothetical protein
MPDQLFRKYIVSPLGDLKAMEIGQRWILRYRKS